MQLLPMYMIIEVNNVSYNNQYLQSFSSSNCNATQLLSDTNGVPACYHVYVIMCYHYKRQSRYDPSCFYFSL